MINFFKKNKPSVPKEELTSWLEQVLDTNLLRWIGYKNKQEYEDEMQHQYNKEKFINENKQELEEIYLIRKKHNLFRKVCNDKWNV